MESVWEFEFQRSKLCSSLILFWMSTHCLQLHLKINGDLISAQGTHRDLCTIML